MKDDCSWVTIITGGGLTLILGDGVFALTLLTIMKIIVDVKACLQHHSKNEFTNTSS